MTLPASAAEGRRLQQISMIAGTRRQQGAQQQTSRTSLLLSIDGTDGQTDGRTDTRPFQRPCSAYAASLNNGTIVTA